MRKAMTVAGIGVNDMADSLGVNRNTVSRWINGTIEPRRSTLQAWAALTGAPFEWLLSGAMVDRPAPQKQRPRQLAAAAGRCGAV